MALMDGGWSSDGGWGELMEGGGTLGVSRFCSLAKLIKRKKTELHEPQNYHNLHRKSGLPPPQLKFPLKICNFFYGRQCLFFMYQRNPRFSLVHETFT